METARKKSSWWKGSLALLVLIIGLTLTFFGWKFTQGLLQEQKESKLFSEVDMVTESFKSEIGRYDNALAGAKGLFSASVEVERDEFEAYFKGIDVAGQYPGIYSFVYVSRVFDADVGEFIESVKSKFDEKSIPGELNFDLAEGPEHYIVNFIAYEHEVPPVAYGMDLKKDENRRRTIESARDTGLPAASAPLVLRGPEKLGFILTTPIYVNGMPTTTLEERKEALLGFVNAAFVYEYLFDNIFSSSHSGFEIHIKDAGVLIHDSEEIEHRDPDEELPSLAKRTISVGGGNWEIEFYRDSNLKEGGVESNLPLGVLIAGSLFSLLLFGITYVLSSTQARAIHLANEMTAKLRESEERFKAYMDNTTVLAWLKDPSAWNYVYINKLFATTFNVPPEEISEKTDFDLFSKEVAEGLRANDEKVLNEGKALQAYEEVPLPDGTTHHWLVFKFPLVVSGENKLIGGTAIDVTVEREAQEKLKKQKEEFERMNKLMVGRELKMAELKKKVAELEEKED